MKIARLRTEYKIRMIFSMLFSISNLYGFLNQLVLLFCATVPYYPMQLWAALSTALNIEKNGAFSKYLNVFWDKRYSNSNNKCNTIESYVFRIFTGPNIMFRCVTPSEIGTSFIIIT